MKRFKVVFTALRSVLAVVLILALSLGAARAFADSWSSQSSGTTQQLNGVYCVPGAGCMAVGANGTILLTTNGGSSWTAQNSGTTKTLSAVACPSASECVAVGASGTILLTTNGGSSWTAKSSGTTNTLSAVACPSASECVAVGASGTILVTTNSGSAWTAKTSGTTNTLSAVACPVTAGCIAVGAGGTILLTTSSGSTWTAKSSGTTSALYGAACPSSSECFATGAGGTILVTSNSASTWSAQSSGTTAQLGAISCVSTAACWAAGATGAVVATTTSGTSWVTQTSGTANTLYGAACITAACYAVGASGTVIDAQGPTETALPTISGTASPGQTLTASSGTWSGASPIAYSYQWELCNSSGASCTNVSGATASTYSLPSSAVGSTLRVSVTASNTEATASATSAASATVQNLGPVNTAAPTISGTDKAGQVLTASNGTWTSTTTVTYSYQWQDCNTSGASCTNIANATASTYTLANSDVGMTIKVVVTASNTSGSTAATSSQTGTVQAVPPANSAVPTVSGTAEAGMTLTATTGTWSGSTPISYSYQWQDCNTFGASCTNVTNATASTYTLATSDIGDTVRVLVTASNASLSGGSSAQATSAVTATVQSGPPIDTASPTISGTSKAGQTLTASTGTWSSSATPTYAYQWNDCSPTGASCTPISSATANTYTLSADDVGNTITVVVTATNSAGSNSATSAASTLVEPLNGPACSEAWTGATDLNFLHASNWYPQTEPTSSSVACIGNGYSVYVTDTEQSGSIQAAGAILVPLTGAKLTLASTTNPSEVGTLSVGGTLSIAGSLTVDSALYWDIGTITGGGALTLGANSVSSINPKTIGSAPVLDGATLVNQGSLTMNCSTAIGADGESVLEGADGAVLQNTGLLTLGSSEAQLCGIEQGNGAAASLENESAGTIFPNGYTYVNWEYANSGSQPANSSGGLYLAGGEATGQSQTGSWEGDYFLSGNWNLTGATITPGVTVTVGPQCGDDSYDPFVAYLSSESAQPAVTFGPLSAPGSVICTGAGTAIIGSSSATWNLGELIAYGGTADITAPSNSSATVSDIEAGSGGTVDTTGNLQLSTVSDEGSGTKISLTGAVTLPAGYFDVDSGAIAQNSGTITVGANDSTASIGVGPDGEFDNSGVIDLDQAPTGISASCTSDCYGGSYIGGNGEAPAGGQSFGVIDGGGSVVSVNVGTPSLDGQGGLFAGAVFRNQTVDLETTSTFTELNAFYQPTEGDAVYLSDATINNYGDAEGLGPVVAVDGTAAFNNSGTVEAAETMFLNGPGQGTGMLVNESGATLAGATNWADEDNWVDTDPNIVDWTFTNSGTVDTSSWFFEGQTSGLTYGGNNPSEPNHKTTTCGDPVVCSDGDQTEQETDLYFGGLDGLSLTRTYNSQLASSELTPGIFGWGWSSSFGASLEIDTTAGTAAVEQSNGSEAQFTINSAGAFVPVAGVESTLVKNSDGSYTFTLPDQSTITFSAAGQETAQTSRTGQKTTLQYNSSDQLISVTAASGRAITFTYNTAGFVATATDPAGLVVSYAYDSDGRLTSVSDSGGPATTRWQYGYANSGTDAQANDLTSLTDADGKTTTIAYVDGQVVSQTDPLGRKTTWTYAVPSSSGGTGLSAKPKAGPRSVRATTTTTVSNTTTVILPNGSVTKYVFNSQGEPTSEIRADGTSSQTTTTTIYNAAGEPTSVTDGNGNTTTYSYDAAGNRISETDPLGHKTSFTYDGNRNVLTETLPSGKTTTYTYNSQNLPTSIAVSGSGVSTETSTRVYNSNGEVTSETDALGNKTNFGYDSFGDLASVTDPTGDETTYTYDADGRRLTTVTPAGNVSGASAAAHTTTDSYDLLGDVTEVVSATGATTTHTYDGDQHLLSTTDPDGNTTSYSYDDDGELQTTTLPDGSTRTESYDSDGNVASRTNGNGNTTTYSYTPLDQLKTATDPLGRVTSYTYDADGNQLTVTDPLGRVTTDTYNGDSQLATVKYSDGKTAAVTYGYASDGQINSLSDGTGASTYTYDGLDRLTSLRNGAGKTVNYVYNADNAITSIKYPDGNTATFVYDTDGRMSSVSDWLGHTIGFAYTPDSALATTTFPSVSGDIDSYTYNADDRLTGVTMTQSSTTLASVADKLDPVGLVTNETQTGLPGAASTGYTYDADEQLSGAGSSAYGYNKAYDATEVAGVSGFTYDKADELTATPSATYAYDTLGERITSTPSSGSATTYAYNQAGELTGVSGGSTVAATYSYDGNGELASETSGGSTKQFVWDATASTPNLLQVGTTDYIYGPDGLPVEEVTGSSTVSYLHHDRIGSTRLITNTSGATVATFTYTPYGTLSAKTGTATTDLGYAGQYTDNANNLQYDQARWYDPTTAQFLTVDPMAASTWQPYSYANDNPINDNDPTGMDVELTGGSSSVTGTTPAQAALEVLAAPVSELAHSAPYLGPIIDIAAGVTCVAEPEVCLMTIAGNTAFQEFSIAAQKAFTQCYSWNNALAAQMPILVGDALGGLGYMATKFAGDELGTWGKVALGTTVGAPQVIFDGAMIAKAHSATSG